MPLTMKTKRWLIRFSLVFFIPGSVTSLSAWAESSSLYLEAIHVPTFRLRADREDINNYSIGPALDYSLETGRGYGIAVGVLGSGMGDEPAALIDVLYLNAKNTEKDLGFTLETHAMYLEFGGATSEPLSHHVMAFADLRIGVGGAYFVYPSGVAKDNREGAIAIRGQFGLEFYQSLQLSLGFGVYMWGYPGETVAQGDFSTLQLGLRF